MTSSGFELRDVGFRRGPVAALDALTLHLPPRGRTAIVGPSGAGKSTLLRLLAGLEVPSQGEILLDGDVVSRMDEIVMPPHRRGVSMVFQDLALWPNLSVRNNILLGLSGTDISAPVRHQRTEEMLDLVGLAGLGDRSPASLSGGEQQRVALARAMAPSPAYLFLDEPFASIDLTTKTRLFAEIKEIADRREVAILLVTHDPLEALALCTEAAVLEDTHLIERGSLRALLNSPEPRSKTLRTFRCQLSALIPGVSPS